MKITTVAIVGGGRVGSGIATITAQSGLKTIVTEKTQALAEATLEHIIHEIDSRIARWGMTESDKKYILSNLDIGHDLDRSHHAELVICSIPAIPEEQKAVFTHLNAVCAPETIFSSSTLMLSITELASVLTHPDKMLGLHFRSPVFKTELVEIVRGFATSDETFNIGQAFIKNIGRVGIEVFETPGGVTTRVILPLINEAMYVLLEGVASAWDIDTAMRVGFNMEVGPLELADRIGLDRVLRNMEMLFHETGDMKFRPCPLIQKLVRAQHYGENTGEGFFTYDPKTGERLATSALV